MEEDGKMEDVFNSKRTAGALKTKGRYSLCLHDAPRAFAEKVVFRFPFSFISTHFLPGFHFFHFLPILHFFHLLSFFCQPLIPSMFFHFLPFLPTFHFFHFLSSSSICRSFISFIFSKFRKSAQRGRAGGGLREMKMGRCKRKKGKIIRK